MVSIASGLDIRTEREQNRQNCRVFRSASLTELLPKNILCTCIYKMRSSHLMRRYRYVAVASTITRSWLLI
jgi:hypothetical protein